MGVLIFPEDLRCVLVLVVYYYLLINVSFPAYSFKH